MWGMASPVDDGARRRTFGIAVFALATVLWSASAGGPQVAVQALGGVVSQTAVGKKEIRASYVRLPLSFELNRGQAPRGVDYLAHGNGYTLALTAQGAALALKHQTKSGSGPSVQLGIQILGANPRARVEGLNPLPGKVNYYVGNDAKRWLTGIPTVAKVRYRGVYPGIDITYYGNQRNLEYDFTVAPGADPKAIQLGLFGAKKLQLDEQGNLVFTTTGGQIRQQKPFVYQLQNGARHQVAGRFVLDGRRVGFAIGRYDKTKPLVIDPTLAYSSYLGGDGEDPGFGIAVDPAGNVYVTGVSNSLSPGTVPFDLKDPWGPEGAICCGGGDTGRAFVTKMNPTGTALIFSTYIGGFAGYNQTHNAVCPLPEGCGGDARYARGWDSGFGIAADTAGNAYVGGWAESLDFPTTSDAVRRSHPGPTLCAPNCYTDHPRDGFLAIFSPTGSLTYSSLIGGHGSDGVLGIDVVDTGSFPGIYLTGLAQSVDFFGPSPGTGSYPAVNAYQTQLNVNPTWVTSAAPPASCHDAANNTNNWACWRDGFAMRLTLDGKTVIYSTLFGGTGDDGGYGVKVDPATGNAYYVGEAESTDFPTTAGVAQECHNGNGGYPADLALQSAGMTPFACHLSPSPQTADYPTQARKPPGDAYVAKFGPTGGAPLASTYLGGSDDDASGATQDDLAGDYGKTVGIDNLANVYVTGWTESFDSLKPPANPAGSPPATSNGRQNNCGPIVGNAQFGNSPCPTYVGYPTTPGVFQDNLAQDPTSACGAGAPADCVPPNRRPHANAFVTKLTPTLTLAAPGYSTYVGGFGDDAAFGLAVDSAGQAYIVGSADSFNYPTTIGKTVVHPACATCGANINGVPPPYNPDNPPQFSDAFITKLNPTASGATALLYSTYLGGSGDDVAHGVVHSTRAGVNGVYVSGLTTSSTTTPPPKPPAPPGTSPPTPPWPVPWYAFPTTPDAFQGTSSPDRTVECNCGTPLPAVPNEEAFIVRLNDNADEAPAAPVSGGGVTPPPPPTPDFSLASSPSSLSLDQGGPSKTFNVSVTGTGAFGAGVLLESSSTPAGLTVTPASVNSPGPPPYAPKTFTVGSAPSTPGGNYTVTVTGTGGGKTHTTTVSVTVVPPDFSLAASPGSLSFARDGGSGTVTVDVKSVGGFTGSVALTPSSTPAGLTFTPTSANSTSPYSPSKSFQVTSSTAGTYTIKVTGTSGSLSHETGTVTVTVKEPDFTVSVSPSQITAQPNAPGVYTVTLKAVDGWVAPVNLSVTKPANVTATWDSPGPTGVPVPGLRKLTLKSASVGIYTITVTGTGTSNTTTRTRTKTFKFAVNQGSGCSGNCP